MLALNQLVQCQNQNQSGCCNAGLHRSYVERLLRCLWYPRAGRATPQRTAEMYLKCPKSQASSLTTSTLLSYLVTQFMEGTEGRLGLGWIQPWSLCCRQSGGASREMYCISSQPFSHLSSATPDGLHSSPAGPALCLCTEIRLGA